MCIQVTKGRIVSDPQLRRFSVLGLFVGPPLHLEYHLIEPQLRLFSELALHLEYLRTEPQLLLVSELAALGRERTFHQS